MHGYRKNTIKEECKNEPIDEEKDAYDGLKEVLFEGLSLRALDYCLPTLCSLHNEVPFSSGLRERGPQHGRQLLETFLDHPHLSPGMRYQLRMFLDSIRTSRPKHDNAQASRMWKQFVCQERLAYANIGDRSSFQVQTVDGMKDIGPARPSGKPESILHIVHDYPKLEPGTFTHLKSPPLDIGSPSGHLLMAKGGKGFQSRNCFVFESFPRRCDFKPTLACPSPRDKWPTLGRAHDRLHAYWRSRGGKVVLVMGDNAEKAYNDMVRQDNVPKDPVFTAETFDVWIERSRCSNEIRRIVVKVADPANFHIIGNKRAAISMDNGCNFAAALAGVCDLLDYDFFFRQYNNSFIFSQLTNSCVSK